MADDYADELRKLADTVDEAKRDLNLAREQCAKPHHLYKRSRRAAVQAARVVVAAVDVGFSEICSPLPLSWILSAMRDPDDLERPPATIIIGGRKGELRSIKHGSGCNSDGTLPDDTAMAVWVRWICPAMYSRQTTAKAEVGASDFPKVKTDDQGRILGRDGTPLQWIEKTDPETGEPAGWEREGPAARVTDDYDDADMVEHLRCQAADWVDACSIAADLIRKESTRGAEAEVGETDSEQVPRPPEQATDDPPPIAHSTDFRSVKWSGEQYSFTANQAVVVRLLFTNLESETPDVGDETLLYKVDPEAPPARLNVLFRDHPAWGTMIIPGATKGTHRMAEPA